MTARQRSNMKLSLYGGLTGFLLALGLTSESASVVFLLPAFVLAIVTATGVFVEDGGNDRHTD